MLKDEIVSSLKSDAGVLKAFVFGSYARGTPDPGSDIDIIVIIDRKGVRQSYGEMQADRKRINALLLQTRKKIPMDIMVYTNDEWNKIHEDPTDFIRTVEAEAVPLL